MWIYSPWDRKESDTTEHSRTMTHSTEHLLLCGFFCEVSVPNLLPSYKQWIAYYVLFYFSEGEIRVLLGYN